MKINLDVERWPQTGEVHGLTGEIEDDKTSEYLANFIGSSVVVTMTVQVQVFSFGSSSKSYSGAGTFVGVTPNGLSYVFYIENQHYIVPCKDCVVEFKNK